MSKILGDDFGYFVLKSCRNNANGHTWFEILVLNGTRSQLNKIACFVYWEYLAVGNHLHVYLTDRDHESFYDKFNKLLSSFKNDDYHSPLEKQQQFTIENKADVIIDLTKKLFQINEVYNDPDMPTPITTKF